jgi:DNA-binding response OmpR family regulator
MANLILDRRFHHALLDNRELSLDQLEFDVLWILSAFTGRPFSLRTLLHRLDDLEQNTDAGRLSAVIGQLESKLGTSQIQRLEGDQIVLF